MKTAWPVLAILLVWSATPGAQAGQTAPAAPTGAWKTLGLPWTATLKADGTALTGTVSDGVGFSAEIFEGRIDGNTLTFKARSADGDRVVTFIGTIRGDEIQFTRDVEVRSGGNPGGNTILGAAGPREFTMHRAGSAMDAMTWTGTIRNAPTPRNATPNPNPRPVTLAAKTAPSPHWRWRGGDKEIEVRTFTLPMGTFELNTFEFEGDRLTYSFSRPAAGDEVRCELTRAGQKFEGRCESLAGGFQVLIELIPPSAAAGRQSPDGPDR